jgi:Trypsin-co-occurring domain 2
MVLLSEMIQHLREELSKAQTLGNNSDFKFLFESVELELSVAITTTGTANAGIKFWVVEAGGKHENANAQTHKFKLILKPGSLQAKQISDESSNEIKKK